MDLAKFKGSRADLYTYLREMLMAIGKVTFTDIVSIVPYKFGGTRSSGGPNDYAWSDGQGEITGSNVTTNIKNNVFMFGRLSAAVRLNGALAVSTNIWAALGLKGPGGVIESDIISNRLEVLTALPASGVFSNQIGNYVAVNVLFNYVRCSSSVALALTYGIDFVGWLS